MNEFQFELGAILKDQITGFKGVVRVRSQYLTGCNVYGLQAQKVDNKGGRPDWEYFDEALLSPVPNAKPIKLKDTKGNPRSHTGGPLCNTDNPPTRF